ncbi:hypothetical protein LSH36_150g01005 [Paralvinella palmiformis]|uniref:Uncharacterized protein n=1 Tax=Paralvinella palmiformis TaxID=53620 RepID=A0AAD9N937_9ANNE|nr:hypothetical protein LSH36_150g01005 [Paralvinella palmiformis]
MTSALTQPVGSSVRLITPIFSSLSSSVFSCPLRSHGTCCTAISDQETSRYDNLRTITKLELDKHNEEVTEQGNYRDIWTMDSRYAYNGYDLYYRLLPVIDDVIIEKRDFVQVGFIKLKDVIEQNKAYNMAMYFALRFGLPKMALNKAKSVSVVARIDKDIQHLEELDKEQLAGLVKDLKERGVNSESLLHLIRCAETRLKYLESSGSAMTRDMKYRVFDLPDGVLVQDLRTWITDWEPFNCVIKEGDCAWDILPERGETLINPDEDTPDKYVRVWIGTWQPLEFAIDSEAAWDVLPDDVIQKDEVTQEQRQVLRFRQKRQNFTNARMMKRRRAAIGKYLLKSHNDWTEKKLEPYLDWADRLQEAWLSLQTLCQKWSHACRPASVQSLGSDRHVPRSASVQSQRSDKHMSRPTSVQSQISDQFLSRTASVQSLGSDRHVPRSASVQSQRSDKHVSRSASVQSQISDQFVSTKASVQSLGSDRHVPRSASVQSQRSDKYVSRPASVQSQISNQFASTTASVQSLGSDRHVPRSASEQSKRSNKHVSRPTSVQSQISDQFLSRTVSVQSLGSDRHVPRSASVQSQRSDKHVSRSASVQSQISDQFVSTKASVQSLGSDRHVPRSASVQSQRSDKYVSRPASVQSQISNQFASTTASVQSLGSDRHVPRSASVQSQRSDKHVSRSASVQSQISNQFASTTASVQSLGSDRHVPRSASEQSKRSDKHVSRPTSVQSQISDQFYLQQLVYNH